MKKKKEGWGVTGIEPVTSHTRSENHTTRPNSQEGLSMSNEAVIKITYERCQPWAIVHTPLVRQSRSSR
jgi:hypothetical protein